jgi:catechol 2,3-dioxygenase-like lactoylglutathione lyase family enzyme
MIDHIGFAVSDYERAKAFYAKALAPLGYVLIMEVAAEGNPSGAPAAGFGVNGKPDFWIGGEGKIDKPLHVAIACNDRAAVDGSQGGAGGGCQGQRRARASAALPPQLLRRVCLRSRRPQHRGGVPRARLSARPRPYGRQPGGGP